MLETIGTVLNTKEFLVGLITGGGLFALWKAFAGWYRVNLSLQLDSRRTPTTDDQVHDLVCSVKLKKGDRATLHLQHVEISIYSGPNLLLNHEVKEVYEEKSKRFLSITPGEELHYAAHCKVSSNAVCALHAKVVGRSVPIPWVPLAVWRVSEISVPNFKETKAPSSVAER